MLQYILKAIQPLTRPLKTLIPEQRMVAKTTGNKVCL